MNTDFLPITRAASHAVATALAPKSTPANGASTAATASTAKASASNATVKSNATPAATAATTTTAANDNSTITSNDFLTLLVSELKNQDPTQPTDPNAYITQLVGVNSLEQLISINGGITSLDSAATTATTPTTPAAGS